MSFKQESKKAKRLTKRLLKHLKGRIVDLASFLGKKLHDFRSYSKNLKNI